MGFDGRGRWYRYDKKSTVDKYLPLSAHKIVKTLGYRWRGSTGWQWTWSDGHKASIGLEMLPGEGARLDYKHNGEPVQPYTVPIVTTTPHYGGVRYWWLCPRCGRRVAHLYGGRLFLCRVCQRLTYETTQSGNKPSVRIDSRLRAIRRKLGASGGLLDLLLAKPKYMHWDTFDRLWQEWYNLCNLWQLAFIAGGADLYGPQPEVVWAAGKLDSEWQAYKQDPSYRQPSDLWADYRQERIERVKRHDHRLTLGGIASKAGVPFAFAREAQREGLIRPDGGRGKRQKRYRPGLVKWLAKLSRLRAGMTWQEIRDWTRRRFQPGHEHERRWPAGFARAVERG